MPAPLDPDAWPPVPAPDQVPEGTAVLDGPGSVSVPELQAALGQALEHQDSAPGTPALVVSTSGSTGTPKQTVLSAAALRASGEATAQATDSAGAQWLLALPVHYVAGAQVLARSVLAGTTPVATDSVRHGARFTAEDFLRSTEALQAGPRMASLVPTQVHDLLEAADAGRVPEQELLEALRSYRALLLGGAPASAALLQRCRELQVPLVLTYGSAETAGGCVYDGTPLPGVQVQAEAPQDGQQAGRLWLGGPTLAQGYLGDRDRTAAHFRQAPDGTRWYRTDDLGLVRAGGVRVMGRADDVVISGGVKVSAQAVAACLEQDPGVREALVVPLPHPRWGQQVAAVLSRAPGAVLSRTALTHRVRTALGPAAAPKQLLVLDRLPATSTGKPDRAAALRLLAEAGTTA